MQYALGALSNKVKEDLVENPNTPLQILEALMWDDNYYIMRRAYKRFNGLVV